MKCTIDIVNQVTGIFNRTRRTHQAYGDASIGEQTESKFQAGPRPESRGRKDPDDHSTHLRRSNWAAMEQAPRPQIHVLPSGREYPGLLRRVLVHFGKTRQRLSMGSSRKTYASAPVTPTQLSVLVHPRTQKQTNPRFCPRTELRQSPFPLLLEGPVARTAARPERVLLFVDPMSQFNPGDRDRGVCE